MRFQVGDIVRISSKAAVPLSREYPKNIDGIIVSISNTRMFPIKVKFDGIEYLIDEHVSLLREKELKLYKRN